MKQLQLVAIRQGDPVTVPLDPEARNQLISLMAEAIESVDRSKGRLGNGIPPSKDRN